MKEEPGKLKSIGADYDRWHLDLAEHEQDGYVLSKVWYQKVMAALPDLNNKRVLEVGCGRGEFSAYLSKRFPSIRLIATDFSPGAIEVCRRRFPTPALTFQVQDATHLTFQDGEFDVVICCETLEHIPAVGTAMHEISRVLKKGGLFFITTPSYFNAYSLVWLKCWLLGRPYESGQGIQPFEHFYTSRFIKVLLKRNGMIADTITSTHFQWLVWPKVDPAKLRTVEFNSPILNRIFRMLGTHFFYSGHKKK
jgi:ubiquinone/menaquinone biosynthesis C-methylase UbiE